MEAHVGVIMNVDVESMSAWALIGTSTWKVNVDLEEVVSKFSRNMDVDAKTSILTQTARHR